MSEVQTTLSSADYAIAAIVLAVPVAIGVGFAFKDAGRVTRSEYLLGGRKMSVLPVATSLFVTFTSIALMGVPVETFYFGLNKGMFPSGLILSYVFGYFSILPLMYPLHITSIFQYIKLRYKSEGVRLLSAVMSILLTVCYMALSLFLPALALQACLSIPLWMSIIVLGGLGTVYTAIGGIKSVIWTDTFQTFVLFFGILVIIVKGCIDVGGLAKVFRVPIEDGRMNYNKLSIDPRSRHTLWSLTIAVFIGNSVHNFNQATLQRISCMKSLRDAKKMYILQTVIRILSEVVLVLFGFVIYTYYASKQCDPLQAGQIRNPNQLAPYYVLDAMGGLPGMAGLFISILCCGSLSTLSSGINSLAANTVEDILQRPLKSLNETTITSVTKIIALLYGCLIVNLSYWATFLDGPVTQISGIVFGAFGSPITGVFLMGGSVPCVNKFGALSGILSSVAYNIWISIGARVQGTIYPFLTSPGTQGCEGNFTAVDPLNATILMTTSTLPEIKRSLDDSNRFFMYDISYEWYTLMGVFVCVSVGLVVSALTNKVIGQPNAEWKSTDPQYIFPFLRRFWGLTDHNKQSLESVDNDSIKNGERMELVDENEH